MNTATTVTNGGAGNVVNGADRLTITETGSIALTGLGMTGIGVTGNLNIISNAGAISVADDLSIGIYIVGNGNIINNTGTITASNGGFTSGIDIQSGIENIINNSGKIIARNTAIATTTATGTTLNLSAPSFIGGRMFFGDSGTINITTGRSQSVLWNFSTYTSIPTMRFGGDVPWAWNATTEQFATIDPTALSASADMVADLTAGVSEIVRNNDEGNEIWLKSFGSYSTYGASGIYNDFVGVNAGIVGGASSQINKDFYAGVMLGYGVSDLQVNSRWEISQTVNSKGVLGGIYAKSQFENFYADFSIFGGMMGNDSNRLVNDNIVANSSGQTDGIDYATASYNSWFISPELRIGVDIDSGSDWTLTPSAMLRYTHQAIDGYSETGSNANATIGARTVQVLEGNLELAATNEFDGGMFTLAGGLDYRQNIGATIQNVTLIGQTVASPLDNSAQYVGYASMNASYDIGNNASLDMNVKAALGTNDYKSISGTVGIKGKF